MRLDFSTPRHSSAIFISHRHSQRFILQRTKLAKKEHSIWQVHCKWTQWDSTSQHPDTPLLSSSHTDTHNASSCSERNWRRRSTAFDKCIASEHSETRLLNILTLLCYLHLTQTLTTLNLERNEIGDEGAQHLARALKVNRVRLDFSTSRHSSAIFISHRHSQRFILQWTKLAKKEHSIWHVHWKWTQWDSTSQHSDTPLLSSSHTDTHNASSCRERNWRRRSTASGKCIASEHSETRLLNIPTLLCYLHLTQTLTTLHLAVNEIGEEGAQHLTSALQVNTVRLDFWTSWHSSAIFILHRHSQRLILNETKLAMKEHSIWHVHWKWTEWDSTSQHPDTPLLSSSHTDTHNASSCSERNWRRRSTAFGTCIESEHSETRLLNIPTLLCYLHLTQTLTTLHLAVNEIGEEGAQHLTSALQVNTVRLDFWTSWHSSAIFILHRHSQRLILNETKLAMKEHSIWHVHWKWTEWDSTSQHPDTPLLSSSHTDTHNASSCSERNWRRRSTAFGTCIESEHSETRLLNIPTLLCYLHLTQTLTTLNLDWNSIGYDGAQHLASALQVNTVRLGFSTSRHSSAIFISHRHSQRFILRGAESAMKEHSIWHVHCKWTRWDSTCQHPDTPLLSSSHTDTHNASSWRERSRWWSRTVLIEYSRNRGKKNWILVFGWSVWTG